MTEPREARKWLKGAGLEIQRRAAAFSAALLAPALLLGGEGSEGFQSLALGAGVRAAGMGEVSGSLGGDVDSSYWNPANLAFLSGRELSLSNALLPLGVSQQAAAYGHPLALGAASARLSMLQYGDIRGYDSSGGPAGDVKARDSLVSVGYGRPVSRSLGAGLALKRAAQEVGGDSLSVTGADAGVAYQLAPWPLRLSAGLRNLGGSALPRSLDAGVGGRFLSGALEAALECRQSSDAGSSWGAGTEVVARNVLALRLGYRSDRSLGNGVSVGLGIRLHRMRVDYAFLPQGSAFGSSHRVGVVLLFGGAGERAYQQGLALAQEGRHAEAIFKLKEALDANPRHRGASRALRNSIKELERENAHESR